MSQEYFEKINEALEIQKKYSALKIPVFDQIGSQSALSPNFWIKGQAQNYIFASTHLSGQIIEALQKAHLQLAVVGSRTLFEMAVNATYIYNHPKKRKRLSPIQMREVCKKIVWLANKRRGHVNHSKIEGTIKSRLESMGMGSSYRTTYRVMSDWAHLQSRAIQISADPQKATKFGIQIAEVTLRGLHNTFDSICTYFKYALDPALEQEVIGFK